MKSISILGCGWLGKSLAPALISEGYQVWGSTTQEEKVKDLDALGIRPIVITVGREIQGPEYQKFFRSTILIVAIPPGIKKGNSEFYLTQMQSVISETLQAGTNKVLFISSTAVYKNNNGVVTEDDADAGSHLVQAESLFISQRAFETTVIRFAGLAGPGRHPGRFLEGRKALTGGSNPVNLIHQEDCIGIIRAMILKGINGGIFNACAALHPTRKEFYTKASKQLALPPPEFVEHDDAPYKIVSSKKLRQVLDYRFKYDDPMEMIPVASYS